MQLYSHKHTDLQIFLIALGMEDITKEKAEPVYHCAAEIHLRD